jgi:hypothetical protein
LRLNFAIQFQLMAMSTIIGTNATFGLQRDIRVAVGVRAGLPAIFGH